MMTWRNQRSDVVRIGLLLTLFTGQLKPLAKIIIREAKSVVLICASGCLQKIKIQKQLEIHIGLPSLSSTETILS